MDGYDFTSTLSPLDFEILSRDLLQEELNVNLENFSEGRDKGIDLRYAPDEDQTLIVQCKRYAADGYAQLKSKLKNEELAKISKLNPTRYVLSTSVSLSVGQVDELAELLRPFAKSGDIYGRERLNGLLRKFPEIEKRTLKLWINSTGVLEKLLNAELHAVSENEVARVRSAARLYVKNASFDEALRILEKHHVCIISGIPGIGKTTLARMLLLYFYNQGFEVVKVESDIREASAAAYYKKPRFYYYDDFLGQTALPDKLNKNEDQKLLDFIAAVRQGKNSKLVLTTREYILNQARRTYEKVGRESFEEEKYVLDLSKYSRRIRAQILYNHLFFSGLPRDYISAVTSDRGYLRIVDHRNFNPRLIEFLTAHARIKDVTASGYLDFCVSHLQDPKAIWIHAFERQLSRAASNLLLVLTTLPTEVTYEDLKTAFTSFHVAQAKAFGFPCSPQDALEALRELEGTFVASRRVADVFLIKLQNPSVRDFMQNYLLESEVLPSVIQSCTYFEQARWFWETMEDKASLLPRRRLEENAHLIRDVLRSVFRQPSCTVSVFDWGVSPKVERRVSSAFADRLAYIIPALSNAQDEDASRFILDELAILSVTLAAGKVELSDCLPVVACVQGSAMEESTESQQLLRNIKNHCAELPVSFEKFEAIAELMEMCPDLLDAGDLAHLRELYGEFSPKYAAEIEAGEYDDLNDPDDIRSVAHRMWSIGKALSVEVRTVVDSLEDHAREQEAEQSFESPTEGGNRSTSVSDYCSDADLDSMFSTLEAD